MGVAQSMWLRLIADHMEKTNAPWRLGQNDSEALQVGASTVVIPQAGGMPAVTEGYTDINLEQELRVDTTTEYEVKPLKTRVTVIRDADQAEISYNKRVSVLKGHLLSLENAVARKIVASWAGEEPDFSTTGDTRVAGGPSQTGNRKKFSVDDLEKLRLAFDRQDVPSDNRYLVLTPNMHLDLVRNAELKDYFTKDLVDPVLGTINVVYGFKVAKHNSNFVYSSAGAVKAWSAAAQATDRDAAIAFHPEFVRYCVGTESNGGIKVYNNVGQARVQGDEISCRIHAGGARYWLDGRGVVTIAEAIVT